MLFHNEFSVDRYYLANLQSLVFYCLIIFAVFEVGSHVSGEDDNALGKYFRLGIFYILTD